MKDVNELGDMLAFDSLSAAERISGQNYKEDEKTSMLGLFLHIAHGRQVRDAMEENLDTHHGTTAEQFRCVATSLGFREVLSDPFSNEYGPEIFAIWFHEDGILLAWETFRSDEVNNAKIYYNWRQKEDAERGLKFLSSGYYMDGVWIGTKDVREGFRVHMDGMRSQGEFINPWIERPFLWLLNYMEPKVEGYDHEAITAARVKLLSADVQTVILGARR